MAGFLSRSVGTAEHGLPDQSPWATARSLPYGISIRTDAAVTFCFIVGLALVIIPGLVAFTYLALAGPVVKFRHRNVRSSLRRSVQLVRHHFWTVTALATVPFIVGSSLASWIEATVTAPFLAAFFVRVVAEGTVARFCGLVLSGFGLPAVGARRGRRRTASGPMGPG